MGAVAQDETVSNTNPLIFFAYQVDGKLADIFSLKRSVYRIPVTGSAVVTEAEATLNVAAAPTGVRISKGVYHASFTATAYTVGTHEVRWKYVVASGGPEIEVRQRFEVLDKNEFYSGKLYVGYTTTTDLKKELVFATKGEAELQRYINEASRQIELWTGRFFEPRYMVQKLDGKGTPALLMQHPIIGVNKVEIEAGVSGIQVQLSEVDIDGLRIYNRHLQGLLDPDDRDNPMIKIENYEDLFYQSLEWFPKTSQGVWVTGIFGYTDPDGTTYGVTPKPLFNAIGHMLIIRYQDPFGQNPGSTSQSAIVSAKTRDQAVTFGNGSSSSTGGGKTGKAAFGGLTGDEFLDRILISYLRPIHLGAV